MHYMSVVYRCNMNMNSLASVDALFKLDTALKLECDFSRLKFKVAAFWLLTPIWLSYDPQTLSLPSFCCLASCCAISKIYNSLTSS